ncbi:MAG: hypothetical protein KJN97_18355 [Deltaproteobacteria bacterium]|nr:hypothetical protein [Deltaproteobacteria bacterium]
MLTAALVIAGCADVVTNPGGTGGSAGSGGSAGTGGDGGTGGMGGTAGSDPSGWVAQTSGTTNRLWGVSFADANTGTAVGDAGTIVRTTDGGGVLR